MLILPSGTAAAVWLGAPWVAGLRRLPELARLDGRDARHSTCTLFFHFLHPLDCRFVCPRKHGLHLAQLCAELQLPPLQLVRSNFLMSPRPICAQIFAVASGITGCARAVTIRKASALV
jgi:hypothetical protein